MLLNLTLTPKIAAKDLERCIMGQNQNKKIGLRSWNQSWKSTLLGHNKNVEPYPNPQNSLEGPKKDKITSKWG